MCKYYINDETWDEIVQHSKNWVYISWENPFFGHNSDGGSTSDSKRYTLFVPSNISGNDSYMNFVLIQNKKTHRLN